MANLLSIGSGALSSADIVLAGESLTLSLIGTSGVPTGALVQVFRKSSSGGYDEAYAMRAGSPALTIKEPGTYRVTRTATSTACGVDSTVSALTVAAQSRTCLGTQMLTSLSTSTPASLTVPTGAVCADIQADGGTVRMRRDATAPSATQGWRIDDGMSVTVDSVLASVRLLAVSGTSTNVQICFYDSV